MRKGESIMTKRMTVVAAGLVLFLVLPAGASTQPKFGLYMDSVEAKQAKESIKQSVNYKRPVLTDAELTARRAEIQAALNKADGNPKLIDAVAHKYKLVIYQPEAGIQPLSSTGDLNTIQAPTVMWDTITWETSIYGTFQWWNLQAIVNDGCFFPPCNVGFQDGAGLVFTNMPVTSEPKITSWSLTTWDTNGVQRYFTTNPSWDPRSSNQFAIIFSGQDRYLGNTSTSGYYSWYKGTVSVTFNSTWSDSGQVYMTYAHDWSSTSLDSASFGATGSNSVTLSGGLSYNFNNTNKWAVRGLAANY